MTSAVTCYKHAEAHTLPPDVREAVDEAHRRVTLAEAKCATEVDT